MYHRIFDVQYKLWVSTNSLRGKLILGNYIKGINGVSVGGGRMSPSRTLSKDSYFPREWLTTEEDDPYIKGFAPIRQRLVCKDTHEICPPNSAFGMDLATKKKGTQEISCIPKKTDSEVDEPCSLNYAQQSTRRTHSSPYASWAKPKLYPDQQNATAWDDKLHKFEKTTAQIIDNKHIPFNDSQELFNNLEPHLKVKLVSSGLTNQNHTMLEKMLIITTGILRDKPIYANMLIRSLLPKNGDEPENSHYNTTFGDFISAVLSSLRITDLQNLVTTILQIVAEDKENITALLRTGIDIIADDELLVSVLPEVFGDLLVKISPALSRPDVIDAMTDVLKTWTGDESLKALTSNHRTSVDKLHAQIGTSLIPILCGAPVINGVTQILKIWTGQGELNADQEEAVAALKAQVKTILPSPSEVLCASFLGI